MRQTASCTPHTADITGMIRGPCEGDPCGLHFCRMGALLPNGVQWAPFAPIRPHWAPLGPIRPHWPRNTAIRQQCNPQGSPPQGPLINTVMTFKRSCAHRTLPCAVTAYTHGVYKLKSRPNGNLTSGYFVIHRKTHTAHRGCAQGCPALHHFVDVEGVASTQKHLPAPLGQNLALAPAWR